jgi:EAL domain-containing protein (putative c-di-GMP-specific phosphodiesterase class I)
VNAVEDSAEIVDMLSPHLLVQRVADQALQLVPGAEGVLVGFSDEHGVTYVSGAGFLVTHVGTSVDMDASLSGQAIRQRAVLCSDDTEDDPRVDLDACRRLEVASSVCVPLGRGSEVLGVMCVSSRRPYAFEEDDVALLTRMADFMSIAVGLAADLARVGRDLLRLGSTPAGDASGSDPASEISEEERDSASRFVMSVLRPGAVSRLEARQRILGVLGHPELLSVAYQPIVHTRSGTTAGVEALARFPGAPATPDLWFAEAHRIGLGPELELLAVRRALLCLPKLPSHWWLTLNVGPEAMVTEEFADLLGGTEAPRIVLELTEHSRVSDYPGLMRTLQALRATGARLAIDDTGAGFSSLSHILKLAPDFIKLDRELVAGIDLDPVRRVLTASLVGFAANTGAEIIAEGVETSDEMETLEALGVGLSQGFHIGRPVSVENLFGSLLRRRRRHGTATMKTGTA